MMPASRAVCRGSPLARAPFRIRRRAVALIVIAPRARASRLVTGFSPTSTIRAFPASSRWESTSARCGRAGRARRATLLVPLRKVERQAFKRDREVHALELDVLRNLERAGREVQDGLDPGGDDLLDYRLRMRSRNGDDRDVQPFPSNDALELLDVVNRHTATRFVTDLLIGRVEERRDLEPFLAESRVVGQCESQVAGSHDRNPQVPIEPEDLPQVAAQVLDVVADTANAELAEVRQVLANLRGVELVPLRKRLR